MPAQYSDSSAPLLAVDSASPRISVAVGGAGEVIAWREAASGRSSPSLLRMIDEVLAEAGLVPAALGGALGVRGPGSFTGLRVGLSTLLGMHRSLGLAATAVPTFAPLAWQARSAPGPLVAVVDALRGEWFTQSFETARGGDAPPVPLEEPVVRAPAELAALGAATLVGFGLGALAEAGLPGERIEARPLAPSLIEWAAVAGIDWRPDALIEPLYLRPPAATRLKRPPTGRAPGRGGP